MNELTFLLRLKLSHEGGSAKTRERRRKRKGFSCTHWAQKLKNTHNTRIHRKTWHRYSGDDWHEKWLLWKHWTQNWYFGGGFSITYWRRWEKTMADVCLCGAVWDVSAESIDHLSPANLHFADQRTGFLFWGNQRAAWNAENILERYTRFPYSTRFRRLMLGAKEWSSSAQGLSQVYSQIKLKTTTLQSISGRGEDQKSGAVEYSVHGDILFWQCRVFNNRCRQHFFTESQRKLAT